MNKTFKVVFNKARGVMTVVNEATSSVQKKGMRTLVIATTAAIAASATWAATVNVGGAGAYIGSSQEEIVYDASAEGKISITYQDDSTTLIKANGYASAGNYGAVTNWQAKQEATVNVADSVFEGNSAKHAGGAMTIFQDGKLGDSAPTHHVTGSTFKGNTASGKGGGAIAFLSDSVVAKEGTTVISGSTFEENKSLGTKDQQGGGALRIEGTAVEVTGDSSFIGNTSALNGGAIYVHAVESSLTVDGATFEKNTAGKNGGAIVFLSDGKTDNDQKLVVSNAKFTGNSAVKKGGAIAWLQMEKNQTREQNLVINIATFSGNEAETGGAISAEDTLTISGASSFNGNKATLQGGAISILGTGTLGGELVISEGTEESHVIFSNNEVTGTNSSSQGGAIYNSGLINIGDYTEFTSNSATIGGAISNQSTKDNVIGNHVSFDGNTAEWAGAIFNQRSNLKIGDNVSFVNNKATGTTPGVTADDYGDAGMGGAIQNQGTSESTLTIGSKAYFEGNSSKHSYGGAIANYAHKGTDAGIIVTNIGADAQFIGNSAALGGGAIFNNGTLNFEGNATFSGNTAGGVLNDIHNEGIVNVKAGTLTLDGGITGAGSLVFANDTGLSVKVGTSQEDSTTITNDVTLNGTVNLSMTFAPGYVGSYELIQEGTVTGDGAFKLNDNAIFNVTADAENKGTFNISLKDAGDIAQGTGADSNQTAAISALMSAAGGNETFASIATAIGNDLQSTDPTLKQAALDAVTSMSPEVAPMVVQIQTDTTDQVFGVVGSRLGGSQGMASGDGTSGTGLWVQGMVGTTDLDDTSTARGYSADTTGFALGLEAKPSDSTKVGMGFAYTNTDVDGFLRSTDVDSYTAFLYGEYKPSNWFVNGIVSYAWANYDEQRNVLGQSISAKYDADTLGLQLMGGLDLDVSGFTVTPEAGLRYYHIGRDSYTDGMGSAVSDSDEDMLTGVVGARFAKTFEVSPSMTFVPEVRLAMTYDIVDADNTSFVTLANGSSYAVDGETLDRFGFEAGVGVKAEMGNNFELSLSYEGAWRGDYQNHAGILNAKYKF